MSKNSISGEVGDSCKLSYTFFNIYEYTPTISRSVQAIPLSICHSVVKSILACSTSTHARKPQDRNNMEMYIEMGPCTAMQLLSQEVIGEVEVKRRLFLCQQFSPLQDYFPSVLTGKVNAESSRNGKVLSSHQSKKRISRLQKKIQHFSWLTSTISSG
jgi:hypothetical protein